jgi:hypothetical protein
MSGPFGSSQWIYNSSTGFYPKTISGSLRFNRTDEGYLSFTPASDGNRKTWTYSTWIKRSRINDSSTLLDASVSGGVYDILYFPSGNQFRYYNNGSQPGDRMSSAVFRDTAAWYNVVVAVDTTNSTAADRIKVYINGSQITDFVITPVNFDQNDDTRINSAVEHRIGQSIQGGTANLSFGGYMAETFFIDGTAHDADAFGETKNGIWVAKNITSSNFTMGTNGFHLTFEDDATVEAFNTVTYSGLSGDKAVTGVGFQPDFVWIKQRNSSADHQLYDSVRGVTKLLESNQTTAEQTKSDGLKSFDSDGFTHGVESAGNDNSGTHVAWCWDAGGAPTADNSAGAGNTPTAGSVKINGSNSSSSLAGTIAATRLSANTTNGFSIISYTGNGSNNSTVGHGLGAVPDFVITKNRDNGTDQWGTWHSSLTSIQYYIQLNTTGGEVNGNDRFGTNNPTTSVMNLGYSGSTNSNGANYIMYCWAEKTGYSKFGSYTGQPNVTTGFKPAFILIKNTTDSGTDWVLWDNTRNADNGDRILRPNLSAGEASETIDITDTGFTAGTGSYVGASGKTYIYAAFADTREAAFWLDSSSNNNDWQHVHLDHNDTVSDSPTDNHCTMSPEVVAESQAQSTLSDGNLNVDLGTPGSSVAHTYGTIAIPASGKYFFEGTFSDVSGGPRIGISVVRTSANQSRYVYISSGQKIVNTTASSYGDSFAAGDVIGVAVNVDDNEITFFKNGASQGAFTIDLTLSTGGSSSDYFPFITNGSGSSKSVVDFNFGASGFAHTPPDGFVALSTANLPDPAIDPAQDETPEDYFNTVLYTGNGSTQNITGVGFQPDWVWIKERSNSSGHSLFDVIRGATKYLGSHSTAAEATSTAQLTSFDSDGFTTGASGGTNQSSETYVAWNWKAGGSGVSNTNGSITSTVSASTEAGFSIVKYVGTQTAGDTVGHGLTKAPEMIIVKNLGYARNWVVYQEYMASDAATDHMHLNRISEKVDSSADWDDTAPTSTVFSLGNGTDTNDNSGGGVDHIAYCFHSVDGFSKFGSYDDSVVGSDYENTSPFIYTGFRPAFVMIKGTSAGRHWVMYDDKRTPDNGVYIRANTAASEQTDATNNVISFNANGFKIRGGSGDINTTNESYIYMAFADQPLKYANGGTE